MEIKVYSPILAGEEIHGHKFSEAAIEKFREDIVGMPVLSRIDPHHHGATKKAAKLGVVTGTDGDCIVMELDAAPKTPERYLQSNSMVAADGDSIESVIAISIRPKESGAT